uniref:Uncharacterized protein n=1 Tax=Glossina pallidipes TaxID=7398 RepID=A0A1A9ZSD1_GLOPL
MSRYLLAVDLPTKAFRKASSKHQRSDRLKKVMSITAISICGPCLSTAHAHPATELTPERCNPPVTVAGGPDDLIRDPRNVEPAPNVLTPLAPMPWLPTGLLLDTPIQLAVPPWPPLE